MKIRHLDLGFEHLQELDILNYLPSQPQANIFIFTSLFIVNITVHIHTSLLLYVQ